MHLFQDFKDLLEAFVASEVEFVLIGGYADLIANKRASGRPQDLRDVSELERIRAVGAS
jgi:hypothetical protein